MNLKELKNNLKEIIDRDNYARDLYCGHRPTIEYAMEAHPTTILSLIDVVEAAQQIRYEWNTGLTEPQESSLAVMFKALRRLEEI